MKNEYIFNHNIEKVFKVIEDSARAEAFEHTKQEFDILKGVEYENNNMKYTIRECSIDTGYIIDIEEDENTSYTLNIAFESLEDGKTNLIYENVYESKSAIKKLNYKISSLVFKSRIKKRYNSFINYIETMIEEG